MAVYLLTYDLNNETSRPPIVKRIDKSFKAWAKLSESSYAVSTDLDANQIYSKFSDLLDNDDQLYVIALYRPHCGQGPQEVNDWLESSLEWP